MARIGTVIGDTNASIFQVPEFRIEPDIVPAPEGVVRGVVIAAETLGRSVVR